MVQKFVVGLVLVVAGLQLVIAFSGLKRSRADSARTGLVEGLKVLLGGWE